ncbi:unnamed protein product [Ilex paraguariensis]|uniref:SOSEKI DIX-like domain-containing protein n=1 Tax=Ilex paraguariensis TaxID=185542 RepID=A0ABC8UVY5_9AQUA
MEVQRGAEMRRIHIIYFISRRGRIEHPHLVRVHHLSRNGVRLRDVKRWLSELRGNDMPESFTWSYKRKYKTGYVWQDLLDEDLITPISDSEYVLKGSEITSTTSFNNDLMSGEKKISKQKEATLKDEAKGHKISSKERNGRQPQAKIDVSTNTPCEIEEESPPFSSETSTLTDDSIKFEEDKVLNDATKQETDEHGNKFDNNSSAFYSSFLNKKRKKKRNSVNVEKESTPAGSSTSSENSSFMRSKSYSSGASHMFRNLITCGAVDTNDSAMVMFNRRNRASLSIPTGERCSNSSEIVKRETLGGSERIFGTPWNQQQHSGKAVME